MGFWDIYRFLFETKLGIGILVGVCLVICFILAAALERKTRRTYRDRGPKTEEEEWEFLEDDEDEEE